LCLDTARSEAARLGHEYVGAEHLLLGITSDANGAVAGVLEKLGIDVHVVRSDLLQVIRPGSAPGSGPDLPYTTRGKRVLEEAAAEASEHSAENVGTVALLLGVLREGENIAAQVLASAGVTSDSVRRAAAAA
jgi:ATP-dependent Clp protease ATP-binding subunit ClpC